MEDAVSLQFVTFPTEGAFRVHRAPTQLRPRDGDTKPDRFDDPRGEYRVRYFASTFRGSFLEVIDHFRAAQDDVEQVIARTPVLPGTTDVLSDEPAGLVPDAWLSRQRYTVGHLLAGRAFVDVADAQTLAVLHRSPDIQQVLRSREVREAFGPNVRLDLGTICAVGSVGRMITQAVSQAVFLHPSRPSGICYRTRFDPDEMCWAVFDERTEMEFTTPAPLDYTDPDIRTALHSVAKLYGLTLPAHWL
jgi:hypothetical protein